MSGPVAIQPASRARDGREIFLPLSGRPLAWVLLLAAFSIPVSIAASEPLVLLAIPLWLFQRLRNKVPFTRSWQIWGILLFAAAAVVASLHGAHPGLSASKLHRLWLLLLILMVPNAVEARYRAQWALLLGLAFVAGTATLAMFDLVRVPIEMSQGTSFPDTGNMRDPQFYMVALCLLLCFGWKALPLGRKVPYFVLLALTGMGLLLHAKRGVWFSFALTAAGLGVLKRNRLVLAGLVAGVILVVAMPYTRQRLADLKDIRTLQVGGRWSLWTQVAPSMVRDHPWGVGYEGTTHEDFLAYTEHLQPGLDHLHNNVLQILVELGWPGIAVWVLWMTATVVYGARTVLRCRRRGDATGTVAAAGALAGLCALLLNGMVEYNFGDTELLMTFALLIGMGEAVRCSGKDVPEPQKQGG